ncbi:hypothetical protein Ahy_A04g019718 [Arachis hypogaea]|uniref:Sphingomyelin synthase-like domain-containing protein n=1 Tax=Arachis hypogaea TaxID=3818 RepID=A0A445DGH3_ARAHY|nr:hypothetical protein Ahy_A04g019718 [Arachis hypogaea]
MKMSLYIGREASKLWKRASAEAVTEGILLADNWKYLLAGIFCQWTFHPFIFKNKKIYTVLLWCRVLAYLVVCQALRVVTFYSTQLPGPNYHCREGSPSARLPPPKDAIEIITINFPDGLVHGCGDLIFSSHMIFTLVSVITYYRYGTNRFIKQLGWVLAVIQSLLIIASRKHYSVDVVVAWYTVNLVVFFVEKKLPELPDRMAMTMLPLSTKDKDSWSKEESHKLSMSALVDPSSDRNQRLRSPANGKTTIEDGNALLIADSQ